MSEQGIKARLLSRIRSNRQELQDQLQNLSAEDMTTPGVNGEWTVKDTLAHVTAWEQHVLRGFRTRMSDATPESQLNPGETIPEWVARTNQGYYLRNRERPLDEILAEYANSYQQVLDEIEALAYDDEVAIAEVDKKLGDNLDEFFAGDTYDHYPEHTEAIRNWRASRAGA